MGETLYKLVRNLVLIQKYAQLWRCRINVFNTVFKHFLLLNEGKMRYFKIIQRHSIVTVAPLSLASQNTLTKTPARHFPITYEAVTNTFMLDTNHRNIPQPFSRPYTSINSRDATTCKSQDGVVIRVKERMCFNDNNIMYSCDKNNV
jgi:hypothetical protein